jgi:hypothetical protein
MELVKLLRELSPIDDVDMIDVEHIPFSGEDANTACSTVFEEQEVPHDLVQEAFSNVRVKLSYFIGTLPCILFLTFLSLLILGSGRYHHLRA